MVASATIILPLKLWPVLYVKVGNKNTETGDY